MAALVMVGGLAHAAAPSADIGLYAYDASSHFVSTEPVVTGSQVGLEVTAQRSRPMTSEPVVAVRFGVAAKAAQGVDQDFAVGAGFRSFSQAKRVLGPAGEGNQWHHLVEQTPANVA